MANAGMQVVGIMAVVAGAVVLFAPLGAVLITAAKSGRIRVLGWAFAGSLATALLWLSVALILRSTMSPKIAGWWMLSAPWASAIGAVIGWKRALAAGEKPVAITPPS